MLNSTTDILSAYTILGDSFTKPSLVSATVIGNAAPEVLSLSAETG